MVIDSPAVTAAILTARAINALHPDTLLPITVSMIMNIRNSIQKPKAHHSLISQLILEYKQAMKQMSVAE